MGGLNRDSAVIIIIYWNVVKKKKIPILTYYQMKGRFLRYEKLGSRDHYEINAVE